MCASSDGLLATPFPCVHSLLHLARCSSPAGSIRAATAAIVCANRASAGVITTDVLHDVEAVGGRAMLSALTSCPLEDAAGCADGASKRARHA
jgi:hypothetical protein